MQIRIRSVDPESSSSSSASASSYWRWDRISPSTIGQKWPQYKGLSPTPLAIKEKGEMRNRNAMGEETVCEIEG
jgi:hypothetical protein